MHNSRFIFYEPRFVLKREEVDGRGKKRRWWAED
jgi:hypothetical protein